jgi:hypothetical protein
VLIAAAGWLLYIPADPYYQVDAPGVGNRTNVMAAIGVALAVYAVVVLAATLLFRGVPRWWRPATALAVALAAILAVGYARQARNDVRMWDHATAQSNAVLAAMQRALPDPPHGSTIYTFGHPGSVAPGVVVFAFSWDLVGAARLTYRDPTLAAYPVLEGSSLDCGTDDMGPAGPGSLPAFRARYGTAILVNVATATAQKIDSRAECRAAAPRFPPGPVFAPPV